MTRLRDLHQECGQSPWLDNLRRGDITSGHLRSLIEIGVRGLTSNPTIFQKSIEGSDDYDAQFAVELERGLTVREAYWELVIRDISDALSLFARLHSESGGTDGFVSVEIDPSLARDPVATLAAARSLHERIDKPNVMIKIPATTECIPAIRQMIREGRSVNVTLIFSVERYEQVARAYIDGLEDRARDGNPLDGVASVASFFISRVDTEVDARLERLGHGHLRGGAAIAQAGLVYEKFSAMFSDDHDTWTRLASLGASPQRPLWASTSTKNPEYPDTLYVDSLIAPLTVNTLPEATLAAFVDHGNVSAALASRNDRAHEHWNAVSRAGVDMKSVAEALEREGIAAFTTSFDDLIATLGSKARALGFAP